MFGKIRPDAGPGGKRKEAPRLKDVFHSSGFKILVAVIFVMFGLMISTASTGSSMAANLLGYVSTPMEKVSTVVTNNAAATARSKEDLERENAALKKQVDDLNKKLINYYTYQQENAQLRKFLELKNENQDFKPVSAAVVGRDPAELFHQFTIDQGTAAGIAVNDPVVTEAGVVGWISAANSSYSRVTTILSPETNISAVDKVNRETGVVGCDLKAADKGLLRLSYLTAETTVKAGDIIVTSGVGGIYPRNLAVGTVKGVKNSEYDVSLYAEVTPFVDVKTVRDVMVITSFKGQGQALDKSLGGSSSSAGGK